MDVDVVMDMMWICYGYGYGVDMLWIWTCYGYGYVMDMTWM